MFALGAAVHSHTGTVESISGIAGGAVQPHDGGDGAAMHIHCPRHRLVILAWQLVVREVERVLALDHAVQFDGSHHNASSGIVQDERGGCGIIVTLEGGGVTIVLCVDIQVVGEDAHFVTYGLCAYPS